MTDKEKIRKEVERLKGWNNNVRNSTRHMTLQEEDFNRGKHSSYLEILNFIDSFQEEPVSNPIDFEKELYKAFGQVKDFTLGMRIAKRFYDMGKNSQEPVSEDLEEELLRLLKDCEIDSEYIHQDFLHIVANHFADWQKKQMMAEAIDVEVKVDAGGYPYIDKTIELYDYDKDVPLAKAGDRYKVVLIKED